MLMSKRQSSFLVYTLIAIIASISILAVAARYDAQAKDLLEKADFSSLFFTVTAFIGSGCVIFPLWNYLRAYALARKIFAQNQDICLTAEDILLLERNYPLKKIKVVFLGSERGKPMLETLRRNIVFSSSIKH